MTQADLITGFLGAGKTTFLIEYAKYLTRQGEKVAVIVNDHGAINVDRLLLDDALGDSCHIEMVIGGDSDCRRRRLKTKLIAIGMQGYDRVLIEPSGVFDADEFFDLLFDEPLDRWYRIGNVLTLVDAEMDMKLSLTSRYLLASQAVKAGRVILSRGEDLSDEDVEKVRAYLNESLEMFKARRRIDSFFIWRFGNLTDGDLKLLSESGYDSGEMIKLPVEESEAYDSLFFFHVKTDAVRLKETVGSILKDKEAGNIIRIKGFIPSGEGWLEINATKQDISIRPIPVGQELFIVIGENLDKDRIGAYWESYRNEVL